VKTLASSFNNAVDAAVLTHFTLYLNFNVHQKQKKKKENSCQLCNDKKCQLLCRFNLAIFPSEQESSGSELHVLSKPNAARWCYQFLYSNERHEH